MHACVSSYINCMISKPFIFKIVTFTICLLYLASTAGASIHTCKCSGNRQVTVLGSKTSACKCKDKATNSGSSTGNACGNSNSESEKTCCTKNTSHHPQQENPAASLKAGCCSAEVHLVKAEHQQELSKFEPLQHNRLLTFSEAFSPGSSFSETALTISSFPDDTRIHKKKPIIYQISCLRL